MDERRAAPRTCPAATVTCRVSADPPLSAIVQDISTTGLSLLTWRDLPRHTPMWVEAPALPPLAVRVAHVTARPDGAWLIGCELLDPGDEATLTSLLQSIR